MSQFNMFSLDLNQFADSGSSSSKEADYEIPEPLIILLQTGFEVFIVRFADYIFQKRLLLHSDKRKFPFLLTVTL